MPDIGEPHSPTLGDFLDVLASVRWDEIYREDGEDAPDINGLRRRHSEAALNAPPSQDALDFCAMAIGILEFEGTYAEVVDNLRRQMAIAMALHTKKLCGNDLIEINFDTGELRLNPNLSDRRRMELSAILQGLKPPATECDA